MTGGLLQLVATGLDNIFLTSNPSITLFKLTYRRHTNFSVTQRTKQILNISNFGENSQYEFEKEGDIIHNIYLKIDISDFQLQYQEPTTENIQSKLNDYGLDIVLNSNDIINIDYYENTIIPLIIKELEYYVLKFNNNNSYILKEYDFFSNYDTINRNINQILNDNYTYLLEKDFSNNLDLNILFLIFKSYYQDIINNNKNIHIYKASEIYNKLLNDIIHKLTYNILGIDVNYVLEEEFYNSIKLLYDIENNNKIKTKTLYNILNNQNKSSYEIMNNMYHNNDIIYNIIINTLLKYTHNTNHFIFGIYKTFTNNISDYVNFSSTIGSELYDNLFSIFNMKNNNTNGNVSFIKDILKKINDVNLNIKSVFEEKLFNDYFNDIVFYEKISFKSKYLYDILSNLSIDKNTGNIVDIDYYYDYILCKYIERNENATEIINKDYNFYNKIIISISNSNMYILNFIPLVTLHEICDEIYEEFSSDKNIKNIDVSIYDYRNLKEINNFINYNQKNLHTNQLFKNNLYKQLILNTILEFKKKSTNDYTDYIQYIFESDDFNINNFDFINSFSNIFTTDIRSSPIFLCNPENLCELSINMKKIKLNPIQYIIESIKIDLLNKIYDNYSDNYDYINIKLEDICNRYNKFQNNINLTNNIYTYNSYKLNGMSYTNIENNYIQKVTTNNYSHAQSSIYSHCYNMFIRIYNSLFNDILLSQDYFENNLGSHYKYTYEFIKNKLIDNNINYLKQDTKFEDLKQYYSYELHNNIIYLYDENINTNYPIIKNGFNYYSIGDIIIFNNNITISIKSDIDYSSLSIFPNIPSLEKLNKNKNMINNLHNLTYLDYKYLYTNSKLFYNIHTNNIIFSSGYISPYSSKLIELYTTFNNNFTSIKTLLDDINLSYSLNLSIPELNILNYIINNTKNCKMLDDVVLLLDNILDEYRNNQNPFNNQYINSQKNFNNNKKLNYDITKSITVNKDFLKVISNNILGDKFSLQLYNNFASILDIIDYILHKIIQISEHKFLYKNIELNNEDYLYKILNNLSDEKNFYLKKILKLSTITDIDKIIDSNTEYINYNENIPYVEYLYVNKEAFIKYTDILYRGSKLDTLLRNMILQNPVKTCWVPELGYYIIQNISLHYDQLLIDEYDSNLMSLLRKLNVPYDQNRGLDKMIGNTINLITYDSTSKGNIKIYTPLNFYFCKHESTSLPMINLLYTKGTVQFKLRNLNDLLIYDSNAIFIKKPSIKCHMLVKYIYIEEEERIKISKSKLEFLIERYKNAGSFYYNYNDLLGNKILCTRNSNYFIGETKIVSRLRMVDPTKYILWRLRIKYSDKNINNYFWNKNGYIYNNKNIKTISYIKIFFNSKIREQGQEQLFNLVNPNGRYLGSLNNGEYIYCFALFPLIYQPSGSANLSQIEDIMIEHILEPEFVKLIKENNLVIEMEYWSFGYNIMRMISGMAAPLFLE